MPILSSLRSAGITFGPTTHPKGISSQAANAEYAWIQGRFNKLAWWYPSAKRVKIQLDEIWLNNLENRGLDVSWDGDRRYGGTCEWSHRTLIPTVSLD
jgi:hypothetical protein